MNLRDRLVTGSLYTLFASLAVQAVAMVTTIIYARLLGPDDFGVLGIFLSLGAAIVPFLTLGLNVAVTKFAAEFQRTDPEKAQSFLGVAGTLTLVSGAAISVVYFALADSLAGLYGQPILTPMIRISAAFLLLGTLTSYALSLIQGFQEIKKLALLNLAVQSSGIPITFVFVSVFGLLGAAIGGAVFATVAITSSLSVARGVLRRRSFRLRFTWNRGVAVQLLRFSVPLLLSTLLLRPALLFQASIVALWLSYRDLAMFRVATSLYRVALLMPGVLSVPLLPALSEVYATQPEERTRTQMTSLIRLTMFLALPLGLVIGLGSTLVIPVLYGGEFRDAAVLLYVLSFAAFLDTMSVVMENTLLGTGRTWYVLGLNGGQVVMLVGGTAILVPAFGVIGAAYATVLSAAAYFVGAFWQLGRRRDIALSQVRDIAGLAVVAFSASALLVWFVGLNQLAISAVLVLAVLVPLLLLLKPRDRAILRAALRAALGRSRRPPEP